MPGSDVSDQFRHSGKSQPAQQRRPKAEAVGARPTIQAPPGPGEVQNEEQVERKRQRQKYGDPIRRIPQTG